MPNLEALEEGTSPWCNLIGRESLENKFVLDWYPEVKNFKDLLLISIYVVHQIATILKKYPGNFLAFSILQKNKFTAADARFYKKREDEHPWVPENLDEYEDNGIFLIETAPESLKS